MLKCFFASDLGDAPVKQEHKEHTQLKRSLHTLPVPQQMNEVESGPEGRRS